MARDDQGALIVNQATAVVVAAWLQHATTMVQAGHDTGAFMVEQAQLVTLVNDVQNALRSF
jgi:hypothetical protein